MKKKVKRYGGSLIILFSKEECDIYDIKEGNVYDVELAPINSEEQDG